MQKLAVNKVAVLGSGVMGSQIAAHFANCGFQVYLYDINNYSSLALKKLTKLKPSPLVTNHKLKYLSAFNYDEHLDYLSECNLIIEAIAENLDIKLSLYNKVCNFVNKKAILCTNTSGLSINKIAESLDNSLRDRFCGIHFFNPPRYQKLVEIIPSVNTNSVLVDQLEEFLTRFLGKGIVRAKDTPNFIANRIGVFSLISAMVNTKKYNLSFELVDSLTGTLIGRPKSATYRTADVVGLDTLHSVINTMTEQCTNDPWHQYLQTPDFLLNLINNKCLGQKSGKGFYTKDKEGIKVFDLEHNNYVLTNKDSKSKLSDEVKAILKNKDSVERFSLLRNCDHPQAQFLWDCYRDLWHYAAYHLQDIAGNVANIDKALCWGFGWQQGPFELWQAAGWQNIINWINEDITNKKSLVTEKLPSWVISNLCSNGVYKDNTSYNSICNNFEGGSSLKVYDRQLGSKINLNIILENDSAKLWSCLVNNNKNLVFSFKTKMNIINNNMIALLNEAIDYIETSEEYHSLVLYQDKGEHFCAGADLTGFMGCAKANDYTTMDNTLKAFQHVCSRLKHCSFPVVAAVKGLALGGGCELLLHCDKIVAAHESYIGLVEVGVGVVPSGGGCKEMLVRADDDKTAEKYFYNIATAATSTSAHDALDKGYLRETDVIIAHNEEILYVALENANTMSCSNYVPPVKLDIKTGGKRLAANIKSILANFYHGNFMSEHDNLIANKIAYIFAGSEVDQDTYVSEEYLFNLEREAFIDLLKTEKTQARITRMLETGKPLRN